MKKKASLKDMENFANEATGNKEKPETKIEKQNINTGKVGRPPIMPNRQAKVYFYTTKEVKNRIDTAFLKEKIKQTEQGNKLDKSLFIENAIIDYLKKNNY